MCPNLAEFKIRCINVCSNNNNYDNNNSDVRFYCPESILISEGYDVLREKEIIVILIYF